MGNYKYISQRKLAPRLRDFAIAEAMYISFLGGCAVLVWLALQSDTAYMLGAIPAFFLAWGVMLWVPLSWDIWQAVSC